MINEYVCLKLMGALFFIFLGGRTIVLSEKKNVVMHCITKFLVLNYFLNELKPPVASLLF